MASYNKRECKSVEYLLSRINSHSSGDFYLKVYGKTKDNPIWKGSDEWVTIRKYEPKKHLVQMSRRTFDKIKDHLIVVEFKN